MQIRKETIRSYVLIVVMRIFDDGDCGGDSIGDRGIYIVVVVVAIFADSYNTLTLI